VRSDGTNDTLVCDLNKRQWFRFSNIAAISKISSGGSTGMERIWAGIQGTNRLARTSACFAPTPSAGLIVDANGVNVLPYIQTPWYRLGPEGRKRTRFAYVSYDARISSLRGGVPAEWRIPLEGENGGLPDVLVSNPAANVLDVGYLRSPQDTSYTDIGGLPSTTKYSRFRLPVRQQPYGIAFQIKQTAPTTVLRLFDFAVESWAIERSQV
jgi:hypothetical protein